ncbi:ExeA family protein [Hydrogenophaga laconesensis]|uniref:General secretion pathway protein A n=1 Tax=Hydrogenophaga laconesensis TaxID=1805971 RepID=A0ABU1V4N3_9BURK|nr:AAA family ATPase [Hydrogenophaga laconesensis]MDR7092416.1 general secretion pathway protein A [Hydrogenophaga laconesensis]
MYAEFFGLKQDPFSIAPDPRYLFMSERHREALAHLLYGIRGGGGFVLLSGEIGAGKTTICRCFLEQIPEQCRVAYIFNPKLTVGDLLRTICREFHVEVKHEGTGPATIKDYLDPFNEYLLESHARGERNVLIIDEAQNLTPHVLEQLRLLTNLETRERKLLQIILIGQPELRDVLARPELEQLAQRVIARFHLGALNEAETRQYIEHRMQVAGLRGPLPFSSQAIQRIHEIARGVPRRVNLLCDRALLGAYATNQARVDRAVVDKAAVEVFGDDPPPVKTSRRPALLSQAVNVSLLGTLGIGLVVGALVAGALFWLWNQSAPRPVPTAVAAPPPAVAATTPATTPPPRPEPLTGPPEASALLKNETEAWRALGPLWGQTLASDDPCNAAQQAQLQCYRTDRLTVAGLRQLNRPGIVTLRPAGQGSGMALVTALDSDTATLQAGEQRWRMPLATLTDIWSGDFATLWRTPPGQTTRLVDGRTGPAADWLGERIANLQAAGKVPPSAKQLTARIQAFQRANGIEAAGLAGPITFMQVNLASGVDEPRLATSGS